MTNDRAQLCNLIKLCGYALGALDGIEMNLDYHFDNLMCKELKEKITNIHHEISTSLNEIIDKID